MNKALFNSAAKWAILLGVIMSASKLYESKVLISGDFAQFATLTIEWIIATVLYIYILYRANKSQRNQSMTEQPERGYKVRDVINYSILISALAAVIVAVTSHIYVVNVVGGYDEFLRQSAESMMKVISQAEVSQDVRELYDTQMQGIVDANKDVQQGSLISTIISVVANYIISGFVIGAIIGYFTKRKPEISEQVNE